MKHKDYKEIILFNMLFCFDSNQSFEQYNIVDMKASCMKTKT